MWLDGEEMSILGHRGLAGNSVRTVPWNVPPDPITGRFAERVFRNGTSPRSQRCMLVDHPFGTTFVLGN
jgi:hypothetical protein